MRVIAFEDVELFELEFDWFWVLWLGDDAVEDDASCGWLDDAFAPDWACIEDPWVDVVEKPFVIALVLFVFDLYLLVKPLFPIIIQQKINKTLYSVCNVINFLCYFEFLFFFYFLNI